MLIAITAGKCSMRPVCMKEKNRKRPFARYLAMYGCISTGLIYGAVGVIAILSFLKVRHGGADEGSMLAILNNSVPGYALVCIITFGTLSYIVWRIYESIIDPYHYGNDAKGLSTRAGIALSTVADAFIAYSAVTALFGTSTSNENGMPEALRHQVGGLLYKDWGKEIVTGIGTVIAITALTQLLYGLTRGYNDRLRIGHLKQWKQKLAHLLAAIGHVARGIILGIIAFFFIKAGTTGDSSYVVNTDKAFDFIGDDVGHVWFIAVAAGTICYGVFMFILGMYYNTDRKQ